MFSIPLLSGVIATSGISVDAGIAVVVIPSAGARGAAITSVLSLSVVAESIWGAEVEAKITKKKTTKNLTVPDIEMFNFLSNWAAVGGIATIPAKRKSKPVVKEDEK